MFEGEIVQRFFILFEAIEIVVDGIFVYVINIFVVAEIVIVVEIVEVIKIIVVVVHGNEGCLGWLYENRCASGRGLKQKDHGDELPP